MCYLLPGVGVNFLEEAPMELQHGETHGRRRFRDTLLDASCRAILLEHRELVDKLPSRCRQGAGGRVQSDALPHRNGILDVGELGELCLELLRPDEHELLHLGCRGVLLQLHELLQQRWPSFHQSSRRVDALEQSLECKGVLLLELRS